MPIVFSASCRRHGRRFCSRVFGRGWILLCLTIVLGCASDDYLKVRKVPRNPLAGPLQLLSRDGPQATPRTTQLLRRFDLEELRKKEPAQSLAKLSDKEVALILEKCIPADVGRTSSPPKRNERTRARTLFSSCRLM